MEKLQRHSWLSRVGRRVVAAFRRPFVVIALIIITILGLAADRQNIELQGEKLRAKVSDRLISTAHELQHKISTNIYLIKGIASVIKTEPEIGQERFSELSSGLFAGRSQLRSIAIAPDLIVSAVYPLEGNQKVIGLNYHTNELQREAAYRVQSTGEIVLAGPVDLVQGGSGFIARLPVYTNGPKGEEFWGLVSAVIDVDSLYDAAGLADVENDLEILIRGKDGKGASGEVFYGNSSILTRKPIYAEVSVPGGSWSIVAIPAGGWVNNLSDVWPMRLLIVMIGVSLMVFIAVASHFSSQRDENLVRLSAAKREMELQNQELNEAKSRIEELANQDPLTGIANRRSLEQHLKKLQSAGAESRSNFSLLLVDLDHFKQVNDRFGHAVGDALLKHVATQIKKLTTSLDLVARIGGDEFVVVCNTIADPNRATKLAEKLITICEKPFRYEDSLSFFGISVGIAGHRSGCRDIDELLSDADKALYLAKSLGRNRFEVYSDEMHIRLRRQSALAEELRSALKSGELRPFYQLQFDAVTRRIVGAEALARWEHPQRGLLGPNKFMEIADQVGLTAQIDHTILTVVVEDVKNALREGIKIPRVSVNVSFQRLKDKGLIEAIEKLNIPPGVLAFELHESIFLDDLDPSAQHNVEKLREMGIRIELDDFGTGHTSILSLLKLKPSCLKIDHQLVIPAVDSIRSRNLLKSIIEIGKSLDVEVIAEGVETEELADLMTEMRCDALQGYAFARPLPFDEIISWFSEHQNQAAG